MGGKCPRVNNKSSCWIPAIWDKHSCIYYLMAALAMLICFYLIQKRLKQFPRQMILLNSNVVVVNFSIVIAMIDKYKQFAVNACK